MMTSIPPTEKYLTLCDIHHIGELMESDKEKMLSAVSYIGLWVTGLIVYLVVDKNEKKVRYHAMQAIVFGIAVVIVGFILGFIPILGWILSPIYWLLVLIAIIVFAVKAYKGEKFKIPIAGDIAEKNS